MTTEELKSYCMGSIEVDGSFEEIFFKIHNNGISKVIEYEN